MQKRKENQNVWMIMCCESTKEEEKKKQNLTDKDNYMRCSKHIHKERMKREKKTRSIVIRFLVCLKRFTYNIRNR